jgi:acetyl esterase/lipase
MNATDEDKKIRDLKFADYPGRELHLDLYLPEEAERPLPVIMFIPVGGWRNCQRPEVRPWLTEYGFAVAAIECRVHPEVTAPATVFDCKAGIRWLRAKGVEYGLDPDRIGTWGGSAGGHLSALMAVSGEVAALEGEGGHAGVSTMIRAACDRCGPTDLERMADPQLAAQSPVLREVTDNFVGGPVADHRDIARLVSPLRYVSADCPPILILHGDQDVVVPVAESLIFHDALVAAGVDATLRVLPGEGHGWDEGLTRDTTVEFFRRTLQGRLM